MALQDIINDLIINNAKTDSSHYTVDQLKNLIANTSIDVPGTQTGATTLTYSGRLNDTVSAWKVAELIGKGSNGQIRTIGQTEVGKLLDRPEFKEALLKAAGGNDDLVTEILDGTTTKGVRNPDGLSGYYFTAVYCSSGWSNFFHDTECRPDKNLGTNGIGHSTKQQQSSQH